jgi:metallo-beta-lactamase class B
VNVPKTAATMLFASALTLSCADSGMRQGEETQPASEKHGGFELSWLGDVEERRREPFRIFDNVYYVGLDWVSAYLVSTGDGLILIDSLYEPFAYHIIESIRTLGFEPSDLAFIVVTHGHWDHAGGATTLQARTGARVIMSEADWDLVQASPVVENSRLDPPEEDLVFRDGDSLTLGETTLHFLVTPGHTPGVLSITFPARDGERSHMALAFGGTGLHFAGAGRLQEYMDSVERLLEMEDLAVNLPNHPGTDRLFEKAALLGERGSDDPHPFVSPADLRAWLQERLSRARQKLAGSENQPVTPS